MATLWTAFLWGLGVSAGAAFGAIGYVLMLEGARRVTGIADKMATFNQESLDQLVRRNELTVDTIAQLGRIAETLEEKSEMPYPHRQ